jgi:prephenate dehydrogenase
MWRDIALANRPEILAALDELGGVLNAFRQALEARDAAAIESFLGGAKDLRDGWCGSMGKGSGE